MDSEKIKEGVRLILSGIGEDINREGLLETPDRIARMYEELAGGYTDSAATHLQKRFQLQERLTAQIADAFMDELKPKGVMVLVQAEHMCMTMRGIKKQGAKTVTVVTRGVFDDDERLRTDFYRMLEHC